MLNRLKLALLLLSSLVISRPELVVAQEIGQLQYWLELSAADQSYADLANEIGRTAAFREFLGEGSIVFRETRGPVDALEEYRTADYEADELTWESHYIDVSRDGDLGLTAGPYEAIDPTLENPYLFGHIVSVWKKNADRWELMADMVAGVPGFLSLNVEPDFEDTRPVLEETAHPIVASTEDNTMQSLIEADNLFGRSINFRGGQRALLRYGLENTRVYLPGMAPAVGADAASSVYGAYLDNQLSTTNPISLTHIGGFMSDSKELAYTYGIMEVNEVDDLVFSQDGKPFQTSYLRLWRLHESNEWRIAVEVLRPLDLPLVVDPD
ncbi:MAG: hypothetical protein OXU66_08860 [Gammaproteobacteria bacterium]|nr:hypothetical protein [Gammaproteobacteria bacterium]MDD9894180.1 hypothetical protein [Gammaproteobacteria bacterium]MDD9959040.1 hypothetical protein [Gammaproteobacteria bacterium]